MRKTFLIALSLLFSLTLCASDFVTHFLEKYGTQERPLNNVNIGKKMIDRMAANSYDEELKNAFKELNSIRIVNSSNIEDSQYYFDKAHELVREAFSDYEEVVSVSEIQSKISVFMKNESDEDENLILITLDDSGKFTLITLSGKIDFNSISKLSGSLKNEAAIAGSGIN